MVKQILRHHEEPDPHPHHFLTSITIIDESELKKKKVNQTTDHYIRHPSSFPTKPNSKIKH